MKKLGVIGGIGPAATFLFGKRIVENTNAKIDQDHLPMVILNDTQIPDRTSFLLKRSNISPLPYLLKDIKILNSLDVDIIAIPCNTSFAFYEEMKQASEVPIINMVTETVKYAAKSCRKIGLLATQGTKETKIYQKACQSHDIELVILDDKHQELINKVIYDQVKASREVVKEDFYKAANYLFDLGCEKIILGCTELSLVQEELSLNDDYIDAMNILVTRVLKSCFD